MRKKWSDNLHCLAPAEIGRNVRAAVRNIRILNSDFKGRLPPKVTWSLLLLCYHGWPTRSRCGCLRHTCFLCDADQGDSINHICRCPVVRDAFARYHICVPADYRAEFFLLCSPRLADRENLQMSAIIIATFYKLLNLLRHGTPRDPRFHRQFDKTLDVVAGGQCISTDLLIARRRLLVRAPLGPLPRPLR